MNVAHILQRFRLCAHVTHMYIYNMHMCRYMYSTLVYMQLEQSVNYMHMYMNR